MLFGKKRAAKAAARQKATDEANQKVSTEGQAFIRSAVFGNNPLSTTAAADQMQAALVEQQKLVNPKGKSTRKKRT